MNGALSSPLCPSLLPRCTLQTPLASLHLVIARNGFSIGRRYTPTITVARARRALVLTLCGLARGAAALRAVVHAATRVVLSLWLGLARRRRIHVDVGDATALAVLRELIVVVRALGELGDDVPGVQEAGDETETAEEDVDERVGAADASLDPDCARKEMLAGVLTDANGSQRSQRRPRCFWRGHTG